MSLRVDVVFDVRAEGPYRAPTLDAVDHALAMFQIDGDVNVVRTSAIDAAYLDALPDALVIGPGAPYEAPRRAESVIAAARERGIPLVGT